MTGDWFEDSSYDWTAHTGTVGTADKVTFDGHDNAYIKNKYGEIIVLFAAPTVDWDNYYTGGNLTAGTSSKVSVAQEGKCPWVKDEFGYYVGFFGTKAGEKAKLIGTTCPECGPLNP